MIIALVGRSYTNKDKYAKKIIESSKGGFERLQSYTTKSGECRKSHIKVSRAGYEALNSEDIFYQTVDKNGNVFFYLRSQFVGNVVYVVDDPQGIEGIDSLEQPYMVVYMDCDDDKRRNRAMSAHDNVDVVEARWIETYSRMEQFEASGNYSWYLNTGKMARSALALSACLIIQSAHRWVSKRRHHEFGMPTISKFAKEDWLNTAKDIGFLMVDP